MINCYPEDSFDVRKRLQRKGFDYLVDETQGAKNMGPCTPDIFV